MVFQPLGGWLTLMRFYHCFIFSILTFVSLLVSVSASAEIPGDVFSNLRFINSTKADKLESEIRSNLPFFIFVPGILGSKLERDGKLIWGKTTTGEALSFTAQEDLKYNRDEAESIKASMLFDYDFMIQNVDFYGKFLKILDYSYLGSERHYAYFPYDWRQDNKLSAEQFEDWFLSLCRENSKEKCSLNGRKLIIVAHSMGGLVVKYWFHSKYKKNKNKKNHYPFSEIDKVLFLGTPHSGAPSALATLIKGYKTGIGLSLPRRWIEDSAFEALNKAGHTFPSIYQLLPYFDHKEIIRFPGWQYPPVTVDLYSKNLWRKFDLLKKFRPGYSIVNKCPEESESESGEGDCKNLSDNTSANNKQKQKIIDAFYNSVERHLNNAKKFHKFLNLAGNKQIPVAKYFFSSSVDTHTHINISENNTVTTQSPRSEIGGNGDGRVPTKIAQNWRYVKDADRHRQLNEDHGSLVKGKNFLSYIRRIIAAADRKSSGAIALTDDRDIIAAFAHAGDIVNLPDNYGLWGTPESKRIISFNKKIIGAMKKSEGPIQWASFDGQQFSKNIYLYGRRFVNSAFRNKYYKLTMAAAPRSQHSLYAANNLAHSMIQSNDFIQGEKYCNVALEKTQSLRKTIAKMEFTGIVLNNCATIQENIGETIENQFLAARMFQDSYNIKQRDHVKTNFERVAKTLKKKGIDVTLTSDFGSVAARLREKGVNVHLGMIRDTSVDAYAK